MCTIGAVFEAGVIHTFKQCDLIPVTHFNKPAIRRGKDGVAGYVAMTRQGSDGIWAGVNSAGVGFVAADSYTTTAANYQASGEEIEALFAAYERSISSFASVREAALTLAQFYRDMGKGKPFPAPDISMLTGWADAEQTEPLAIFLEYLPNPFNQEPVRTIERSDGYFVSTNNFRLQPDSVNYPANHSTYLRLNRAEAILQTNPSLKGVGEVLTDQYYGRTELSICRETAYAGIEFHTQATAVFSAKPSKPPVCEYQINGNPRNNPLTRFPWSGT